MVSEWCFPRFSYVPRLHQGFTTFAFGEAQGLLANHFAFRTFDGALSMIFTAGIHQQMET
jgi:hypothetical protein